MVSLLLILLALLYENMEYFCKCHKFIHIDNFGEDLYVKYEK